MSKFHKIMTLFLVMTMMVSFCAFLSVSAVNDTNTATEISDEEFILIEKLEAMGVIKNDYDPTQNVTRRQMVSIISEFMKLPGGNTEVKSPFRDVKKSDEAFAQINALYDLGVISGDGNFNFRPDDYVTYDETMVFVVNAVGHKMFAEREGGFPTGYYRVAIKHGMLDELSIKNGKAHATLIDIYKILNSAMTASTVIPSYTGDDVIYTLSDTENFLSTTYGIKKFRGKVTGNENTYLTSSVSNLSDEQIAIDGVIYDTPGYVYGYFLGYTVDYYLKNSDTTNDAELIYVEATKKANSVMKINSEDIIIGKTSADAIYYMPDDDKEKYERLNENVDVIYNNQNYKGYGDFSNVLPQNGYVELLDNNNDGVYDVLFVYDYENVVVKSVDTYNEAIIDSNDNVIDLDSSKHKVKFVYAFENTTAAIKNISSDDVLSIVRSKAENKIITVYISRKAITGKITAFDSEKGYFIEGEYYLPSYNYDVYNETSLKLGLSGKFVLDINNRIASYSYDALSDSAMPAVMSGLDYKKGTLDRKITVRIFTQDEKFLYLDLAKNVKINGNPYDLEDDKKFEDVLKLISHNNQNNGRYAVIDAYVLKYTVSSAGEISSLDLGGIGGTGNLTTLVDFDNHMLVRGNSIVSMNYDSSPRTYSRYNVESGIIFCAPASGELDNLDEYGIEKKLKGNYFYANVSATGRTGSVEDLQTYSAYTFNNTDISMVDVFLFRGFGTSSGSSIGPLVLTSISEAVDEEGYVCKKLYQGEKVIGIMAQTVSFMKNDIILDHKTPEEVVSRLNAGDVIYCITNKDKQIVTVRVLSSYNFSTGNLIPTLNGTNPYEDKYDNPPENVEASNYKIAKIENVDTSSGLIEVMVDTKSFMLYAGNATIYQYQTATNKVIGGNIKDLRTDDQVVLRLETYFTLSDIIVFRK